MTVLEQLHEVFPSAIVTASSGWIAVNYILMDGVQHLSESIAKPQKGFLESVLRESDGLVFECDGKSLFRICIKHDTKGIPSIAFMPTQYGISNEQLKKVLDDLIDKGPSESVLQYYRENGKDIDTDDEYEVLEFYNGMPVAPEDNTINFDNFVKWPGFLALARLLHKHRADLIMETYDPDVIFFAPRDEQLSFTFGFWGTGKDRFIDLVRASNSVGYDIHRDEDGSLVFEGLSFGLV